MLIGLSPTNRQRLNNSWAADPTQSSTYTITGASIGLPMMPAVILVGGPSHEHIVNEMRATGKLGDAQIHGQPGDTPGPVRISALLGGKTVMFVLMATPELARLRDGGFYLVDGTGISEPVDLSPFHLIVFGVPNDEIGQRDMTAATARFADPKADAGWRFHPHQHAQHTCLGRQLLDLVDRDGTVRGHTFRELDGTLTPVTLSAKVCLCQAQPAPPLS